MTTTLTFSTSKVPLLSDCGPESLKNAPEVTKLKKSSSSIFWQELQQKQINDQKIFIPLNIIFFIIISSLILYLALEKNSSSDNCIKLSGNKYKWDPLVDQLDSHTGFHIYLQL